MTETRPAYRAAPVLSREEWEAAQMMLMRELRKRHRLVRFHLVCKDDQIVEFTYEVPNRFGADRGSRPDGAR